MGRKAAMTRNGQTIKKAER